MTPARFLWARSSPSTSFARCSSPSSSTASISCPVSQSGAPGCRRCHDRIQVFARAELACAYLCSRVLSTLLVKSSKVVRVVRRLPATGCDRAPAAGLLVTRRAARRAERGALDRRGAGAIGVGVRAGAHAYLGPRPSGWLRVGDMMVMGFPLGEGQSGRSVFGGRPRGRGGSAMPGAGRGASA
jgi:hypothetical protein